MKSKRPSTGSVLIVVAAMVAVYAVFFFLGRSSAGYSDNVQHLTTLPPDQQSTLDEKLSGVKP